MMQEQKELLTEASFLPLLYNDVAHVTGTLPAKNITISELHLIHQNNWR